MNVAVHLAIGRILSMMARPYQEGDEKIYFGCRSIILGDAAPPQDAAPNWVRDRHKGAQGD